MLVEDNPEDIAFTRKILKTNKLDQNLVVAIDGKETIEALERLADERSKLPDIILLDINLPDISGLELLTRLKLDPRYRLIPVIMLTGSSIDDDIRSSYDLGAITYLVKPISKDALMQVINNIIG